MGETSDLSALPVPSDGVHRILGQRLGPDSFSELGWMVLRNDPPDDPRLPVVEADFVLADPRQGIVLVQLTPAAAGREPAKQLRQRLEAKGFAEAAPGFLPIVTVQLNDGDVWRLTGLLDFAVAAEPPIEVQGDWVTLVQQALTRPAAPPAPPAAAPRMPAPAPRTPAAAPAAAATAATAATSPSPSRPALPLPEERQRLAPASQPAAPGRSRKLYVFWAFALLTAGAAFGLLNYLGPPREAAAPVLVQAPDPPAPPSPPEVRVEPPAGTRAEAPPPAPSIPAPEPARPVPEREVAVLDALPLPPPPAPPVPPAAQARAVPEPRFAPEPGFVPEVEPPRELPQDWYVAKPPALEQRDWFQGSDPARPPQAAESGGPARIFVHYHRSRRDLADSLAGRASRLGGSVEVREVPATPPTGEIRYFNPGDREMADRLAETLGGSFRARSFTSFSPRPSRGTLEVWVPGREDGWN